MLVSLIDMVASFKAEATHRSSYVPSLDDLEVVGDGKDVRHAVGTNAGNIFVGFVVDHALESDVGVLHDDANWFVDGQGVLLQRGIAVDRLKDPEAKGVVERRDRQNH